MPRGDGSGPAGMGPMTGRAAGFCAGYNVPGFMNPYGGRFASAASFGYPPYPYPGGPGIGGGYPIYGAFRPRGRMWGFGRGLGRFGPGRGRRFW